MSDEEMTAKVECDDIDIETDTDSSSESEHESDYEPLFAKKQTQRSLPAAREEQKYDAEDIDKMQPAKRYDRRRRSNTIENQDGGERVVRKRARRRSTIDTPQVIEVNSPVLTDVQQEHYAKIMTCLCDVFPLYYDFSDMGSGKTPVAVAVSLELDLPIFCIAPVTTGPNWRMECSKYGARIETITGCEAVRGVKNKHIKHGLLTRTEPPSKQLQEERAKRFEPRIADDESPKVRYHVTDKLRALVQRGILLVIDECQSIKNDSDQNRAVGAIARHIVELGIAGSKSRVMMLSGSAFNKEEHSTNVAHCSGMVDERPYSYDRVSHTFALDGADQMLTLCQYLDPQLYDRLRSRDNVFNSKADVEHHIFVLFDRIIRKHLSNAMPPVQLTVKLDCATGYYRQNRGHGEALGMAIRGLRVIVNHRLGERIELGALNAALQEIESQKLDIVIRLVRQELHERPNVKIIVMLWFHRSIEQLTTAFADLEPLILTGHVKKMENRQDIVNQFNRQDAASPRLLLATCQVASTGLNLQDTSVGGLRPRCQFVMPSYHFIPLHQSIKQTHRHGATSDVKVRFIFGESNEETALLQSLSRSSNVLRQISTRQDDKERVRTLTDYPSVRETATEYKASLQTCIEEAAARGVTLTPDEDDDEKHAAAPIDVLHGGGVFDTDAEPIYDMAMPADEQVDEIPIPALERVPE